MGMEADVPPGQQLVASFRPFIDYLVTSSDLSRKTIQKHVDNLWVLGGEIIRGLHETPSLRRKDAVAVLREVIGEDGGPLLHGSSSEEAQRHFDSTCRKLHRFLSQSPR
jgi:hypothetical protein